MPEGLDIPSGIFPNSKSTERQNGQEIQPRNYFLRKLSSKRDGMPIAIFFDSEAAIMSFS